MKTSITHKLAACMYAFILGMLPCVSFAAPPDLAQLKESADQGDHEAQKQLGDSYYQSLYFKNAEHYYRLAAEAGHLDAAYALGGMLAKDFNSLKGKEHSTKGNPEEAFQWYWRLAVQGYSGAQRIVARHYLEGVFVPKDQTEAYKWFRVSSARFENSLQHKTSVAVVEALNLMMDKSVQLPKPSADYELDRIILVMSKEEIAEGERRAVEFRPGPDPGPRIIGLKLNGFIGSDAKRLAIINGKPLAIGESVVLPMAGTKRLVTLKVMSKDSVTVIAEGIAQPAELSLRY